MRRVLATAVFGMGAEEIDDDLHFWTSGVFIAESFCLPHKPGVFILFHPASSSRRGGTEHKLTIGAQEAGADERAGGCAL